MTAKNPYDQYTNNNINTAPKEELTLMLYEGALKFMNQAIMAVENKEYVKANEQILRVQDIFRELQITLDNKYEISKDLNNLYDFIIRHSVEGNLSKNTEILQEVRDLIREFRDTWKEAMLLAKKGLAASAQ